MTQQDAQQAPGLIDSGAIVLLESPTDEQKAHFADYADDGSLYYQNPSTEKLFMKTSGGDWYQQS